MFKLMDKKINTILPKLFLLNWPYNYSFYQFHIFSIIYNLFCGIEIWVDIKFMPKLLWADFVMSRNADRSANSNWLWGEKSQIDFNKNTYLQADRENFLRFAHRFNMFKPATR